MWRLFNRVIDLQISGESTRGAPARVVVLRLERWPPEEVAKEKRLNEARPRESLEVRISEFVASSEHCRILFRKDVSKCITEGSCTSSTIHFIDRNSRRRCVLHDKPGQIQHQVRSFKTVSLNLPRSSPPTAWQRQGSDRCTIGRQPRHGPVGGAIQHLPHVWYSWSTNLKNFRCHFKLAAELNDPVL
jgi:hypothetical protein